jgi:hypothetical protein
VNAASPNAWRQTIKIALPFAVTAQIYAPCVLDLKQEALLTANNYTCSALPFAKHATQNARNTPGIWNVAEFAQKPVKIVLLAVKKEVRLINKPNYNTVKQRGVLNIDKALPVL